MSLLVNNTLANGGNSFYALSDSVNSASNWYNYSSLTGRVYLVDSSGTQILQSISGELYYNSTLIGSVSNWYQYPTLTGEILMTDASGVQLLHAIGGDLYFNNELLAKAGDLSNVADWSLYPSLSTLNMNTFSIINASNIFANADISGVSLHISSSAFLSNVTASGTLTATGAIYANGGINCAGTLDLINNPINRVASIGISAAGLAPYGSLTSPNGTLLTWNGQVITTGGGGSASNWSQYPATSDINANTFNLSNVAAITTSGSINVGVTTSNAVVITKGVVSPTNSNLNIQSGANLSNYAPIGAITTVGSNDVSVSSFAGAVNTSAYTSINNVAGSQYNVTVDRGANPASSAAINLTAQNGGGGLINLTADPALLTPVPGTVNITANGGQITLPTDPPTTVTVGGVVNIDANTGAGGVYTATSAIKMSAAGINSYAGAIPSVASLAGYNFIYGTAGVSVCAGLPASGFQLPGTTYIYGIGSPGFTGVRLESPNGIGMLSDTYATNVYPFDGGGLNIQGRSLPTGYVNITDVATLTMNGSAVLETDFIDSVSGNGIILNDVLRASTIIARQLQSAQPLAPGQSNLIIKGNSFAGNSNYVEIQNADTIAFDATGAGALTGLSTVNGLPYIPGTSTSVSQWATFAAIAPVEVSSFGINNVSSITGVSSINNVAYPPPTQSVSQWATYPAVQNVDISGFNLSHVRLITSPQNSSIQVIAGDTAILNGNSTTTVGPSCYTVQVGSLSGSYLLGTYDSNTAANSGIGLYSDISGGQGIFLGANASVTASYIQMNSVSAFPTGIVIATQDPVGGAIAIQASQDLQLGGTTATLGGNNVLVQANLSTIIQGTQNLVITGTNTTLTSFPTTGTTSIASGTDVNVSAASNINLLSPSVVGTVGAPKSLTVNGPMTASTISSVNDVVGYSTATPISLSTVSGLVSGNQQYNYWVAVNGSDTTGTGSVLRPFASITAALAATLSISDAIPINICIAAGTYTENPTMTRNNTFLQGSVGISDAIIIGTLTFNSSSATTVSQGMSGISVVGNVVCTENTSADVSWYIQNCNVTSYGAIAINCSSTGTGNNNLVLQNTVVTQNTTANSAVNMATSRLNLIQSQINNNTTGSAITVNGNGSLSLFGATLTCAGGATASAIISYLTTVPAGVANSFNVCSFTYTAGTVGVGKCAVFFNNSNAMSGSTTFNNNVFNISGSPSLFLKPGAGAVAIVFGSNTTNVTTLPAASGTLSYAYTPSTTLRSTALQDSTGAAGAANQVLTAGTAGSSLTWATLNVSSLGALAATPAATAYQNQLVMFNTATNALSYDTNAYSCVVVATSATPIALNPTLRGRKYILTGTTTQNFTTSALTANDVGFFIEVKNGNGTLGGDITITGATGNTVIHNQSATQNGQIVFVYWTGTAFVAY